MGDATGARPPASFTCPRCLRVSPHPDDVQNGYCGACHDFTGRTTPPLGTGELGTWRPEVVRVVQVLRERDWAGFDPSSLDDLADLAAAVVDGATDPGVRPGVTVVIPTIPPRTRFLRRALDSVLVQSRPVDALSVAVDRTHAGSTNTRNRALAAVRTEWCAFLDDDDEWKPHHVETLLAVAGETGADVVYPWFEVPGGWDPWPGVEGRPFDADELLTKGNYVPVTVLARTELLREVGGFDAIGPEHDACDDWGCWKRLLAAGAVFHHVPARTWVWHWHGRNTSGRAHRWSDGDDYSDEALATRRRSRRVALCGAGCANGHTRDRGACQWPEAQGPAPGGPA